MNKTEWDLMQLEKMKKAEEHPAWKSFIEWNNKKYQLSLPPRTSNSGTWEIYWHGYRSGWDAKEKSLV